MHFAAESVPCEEFLSEWIKCLVNSTSCENICSHTFYGRAQLCISKYVSTFDRLVPFASFYFGTMHEHPKILTSKGNKNKKKIKLKKSKEHAERIKRKILSAMCLLKYHFLFIERFRSSPLGSTTFIAPMLFSIMRAVKTNRVIASIVWIFSINGNFVA